MRKHLTALGGAVVSAAIFAVLMAPNAAFAVDPADLQGNPGQSSINISGNVPYITYLPAAPTGTGTTENSSVNANNVSILQLADSTAHLQDSITILKYGGVTTNYPARIGLYSDPNNNSLKNEAGDKIKYTAEASVGPSSTGACEFNGLPSVACILEVGSILNEAEIKVQIVTDSSDQIVRAGHYTDTLTLKVGADL